jgi:hypothetical protein
MARAMYMTIAICLRQLFALTPLRGGHKWHTYPAVSAGWNVKMNPLYKM